MSRINPKFYSCESLHWRWCFLLLILITPSSVSGQNTNALGQALSADATPEVNQSGDSPKELRNLPRVARVSLMSLREEMTMERISNDIKTSENHDLRQMEDIPERFYDRNKPTKTKHKPNMFESRITSGREAERADVSYSPMITVSTLPQADVHADNANRQDIKGTMRGDYRDKKLMAQRIWGESEIPSKTKLNDRSGYQVSHKKGILFQTPTSAENFRQRRASGDIPSEFQDETEQLGNCSMSPLCVLRGKEEFSKLLRYPCRCDEDCPMYGDCCQDGPERRPSPMARKHPSLGPHSWTCSYLTPSNTFNTTPRTVFMLTDCPSGSPYLLAARCRRFPPYTYLMDIPVVSNMSGLVYANIFCALCHQDGDEITEFNINMRCSTSLNITSTLQITNMTYHPGQLMWSGEADLTEDVRGRDHTEDQLPVSGQTQETTCYLEIDYDESVGRSCELLATDICRVTSEHKCSPYNYYVVIADKVYRNYECALCNKKEDESIECLPKFRNSLVRNNGAPRYPPSLTDLFTTNGDCEVNQIWDVLHRRCEDVSCGYLFTLENRVCVRNNETLTKKGSRSYLNSSCYTSEFLRFYSVTFPNRSIYLNHTERIYDVGEYEFLNHSWIRVCRPEDRWTPTMNIISTCLISISLVCMILHMAIFFALPNRRNIPSMNLFSMTCSLFIAELIFISLFYIQNYPLCFIISIIMYYFLLASFFWMNVMSIDICRTFHSNTYKIKSKKIFIQYSIYAWSVPLLSSIIAIFMDQFASEDNILRPQFGTDRCWFNNKWGLVAFFTLPSGLIVFVNMMLYAVSVYDIYKQYVSGEMASSSVRKNSSTKYKDTPKKETEKERFLKPPKALQKNIVKKNNEGSESPSYTDRFRERFHRRIQAHKKQRMRLILYCKLAVMMGLTWIFAFVSIHTQNIIFEYLFIVFNGLQGTFIFIAFDCKRKQWEELHRKITGQKLHRPESKGSSSKTKDTSLTSSGSGYKYRWSSTHKQGGGGYRPSSVVESQAESQISENDRMDIAA